MANFFLVLHVVEETTGLFGVLQYISKSTDHKLFVFLVLMIFNWFLFGRDEYLSQFEGREDRRLFVDDIFQQLTEVRKANRSFLYASRIWQSQHSEGHVMWQCSLLLLLKGGIMEEHDDARRDIAEKVRPNGIYLTLKMPFIPRSCKNILEIHCPELFSVIRHFHLIQQFLIISFFD